MIRQAMMGLFFSAASASAAAQTTWNFSWDNFFMWDNDGRVARHFPDPDVFGSFTASDMNANGNIELSELTEFRAGNQYFLREIPYIENGMAGNCGPEECVVNSFNYDTIAGTLTFSTRWYSPTGRMGGPTTVYMEMPEMWRFHETSGQGPTWRTIYRADENTLFHIEQVSAVPEPSNVLLLTAGMAIIGWAGRPVRWRRASGQRL